MAERRKDGANAILPEAKGTPMVRSISDNVRRERERDKGRGKPPYVEEWREFCRLLGGRCLMCGATGVQLTRDHIVPLSDGGRNDLINLQPLCHLCNNRKANSTPVDCRPNGWIDLLYLLHGSWRLRREAYGKRAISNDPIPVADVPPVQPKPAQVAVPYHHRRETRAPQGRFREAWE